MRNVVRRSYRRSNWVYQVWPVLRVHLGLLVSPVLAVVASLVFGGVIIVAIGESPLNAYYELFRGAFGDAESVVAVLQRQVPLLMTGLAYAVAFQVGLIQLGAEGQLYLGAIAAGLVGYIISAPSPIHITVALAAAAVVGALWSGISAYLKAKYDVSEFLTSLMLSYVGTFLSSWLVIYPFRERTGETKGMIAQTTHILNTARLPDLWPGFHLHAGYLIALGFCVLTWFFLYRTKTGYAFRMTGLNPNFAEYGGINRFRTIMGAMLISGALAGIGGGIEVLGVHGKFVDQFSPGYGWDGMAAAILGGSQPLGTFVASFLFSALKTGALGMDRNTMVPFELRAVVQAAIIFFVAANFFGSFRLRRLRDATAVASGKDVSSSA